MSASFAPTVSRAEPLAGNYFVAVYPPFSAWRSVGRSETVSSSPEFHRTSDSPWGLYVHIPFCERRCNYCYYLSVAGAPRRDLARYASQIVREAALYAGLPRFGNRSPRFVYFGGGTPSLLPAEELGSFLGQLQSHFSFAESEEITFECSPKSVNREKLAILHAAGVNRISLGVQQLDDEVLRLNGRIHLVADVERAWKEIRAFDFFEVNIDLIAGLPGQTDASFASGVRRAIDLAPDSITIYQLEVPRNTPLFRALADQQAAQSLADWETKRQRVSTAFEILEQRGYEIRNAYSVARRGRHSRFVYTEEQYRGADLVGIGLSSFSYVAGIHFQNSTSLPDYYASIENGDFPVVRTYRLSNEERMVRELVLQLKLGKVSRRFFCNKFGIDPVLRFADPLHELATCQWLTWDDAGIRLTASGLVRVDRLLPAFYLDQHKTSSYW